MSFLKVEDYFWHVNEERTEDVEEDWLIPEKGKGDFAIPFLLFIEVILLEHIFGRITYFLKNIKEV